MEEILKKIHSNGYWRVNIRPTQYDNSKISNLTEAREIIEKCGVLLRGWDYPHFTHADILNGDNWIESQVQFEGHIEYWRLYQSSQFIHHFACREDYEVKEDDISYLGLHSISPSNRYLSILSSFYTVTEIFEFASRLTQNGIFNSPLTISINLYGMKDRVLFFWERSRHLSRTYKSNFDEITFENEYPLDLIISDSAKLAMKATIHIFKRFNWAHDSDIFFPEEQKKLLERRL